MMTKSKIFTFLAALLLICLVFSHASPLPLTRAVGDKATLTLPKLDGLVTFTQIDAENVKVNGVLKQGIDENDPDNYFIQIESAKASFTQLGISITPPSAGPWEATGPGDVTVLIGLTFSVLHNDDVLDSAKITQS
ncbi:3706_t:CDS:1 [Diversispora eburnea]|uniref:3706_t:CDS:1 n=1 Tax=Diversispora eburnea TaxID=1213867 RepID=A0A9N9CI78_9GLOM|nr:3706_t:CDS:1 [Diversispora eburnea]